jgi:hypothetical protein
MASLGCPSISMTPAASYCSRAFLNKLSFISTINPTLLIILSLHA